MGHANIAQNTNIFQKRTGINVFLTFVTLIRFYLSMEAVGIVMLIIRFHRTRKYANIQSAEEISSSTLMAIVEIVQKVSFNRKIR